MPKIHFYLSAALLTCLVLDPVLAQNRRGGSSGGGSTQRRESPSPSTPRSPSYPSEPRSSRSEPSEPRPSRPSRTSDDDSRGTVRREVPNPQTTRPTPSEPRSGQVDPRPTSEPSRIPAPQRNDRNTGSAATRVRDGQPTPTIRRDGNSSTVIRNGVSDDRRASYGSSQFHQPYGHDHVHVSTVDRHVPYNRVYRHRVFLTPTVYYSHMYRNAQACYYYDWLFCYTSRSNGYYIIDDYPFYVYNGYYHRYSSYDTCNYQLIDTYTRRTVQNFWNLTCNRAYDQCSRERDYWNFREYANRFACAETYREQTYAYFNTFNERDYFVGGYNTSTVDSYYENEYRAPNVNGTFTPSSSQNDNEDEVSPVLGSMSDLGTATSPPPSPSQRHRSRDTQDY